jgi:AcrR family transcriptional regulator
VSSPNPLKKDADLTTAQQRVITAALKLFSEHGVGGTSLRMIATELGVTVAAVYHQYHAKDEIISAAVESQLRRIEEVLDLAEAEPTAEQAREALINGIVDLTIGVGGSMTAVLNDPAVTGSFRRHPGYNELLRRMRVILMGDEGTKEARVRTAILLAALNGTASHPLVAHLDNATLRTELLNLAYGLLRPSSRSSGR